MLIPIEIPSACAIVVSPKIVCITSVYNPYPTGSKQAKTSTQHTHSHTYAHQTHQVLKHRELSSSPSAHIKHPPPQRRIIRASAASTAAANMSDEQPAVDRNDPELKYLTVEKNQFNDPATQAEWTQKRLVWVPHESQVRRNLLRIIQCNETCDITHRVAH